ncbi:MFS transporter [Amycolatopsis regifaucium]|uniref:MFS transporter n=1 Tax=Amycolatopsis regifaucium TaxID=546365 RepID=A0A154MUZ5_9PSEU|nr:MFS transporter [Amycolatopsis regifaucium]KZB87299.1 MFS transporter [Amycolatopsis regifaucium]OKA08133.1 MFS transporter [Amycolatopsis regifaucium]SFI40701.1 Predicted arabinose efflux permease, MFS family [Amycolatopsis regifaucium]
MDEAVRKRRAEENRLAAALTKGPAEVLDFLLPLWVGSQLGASAAEVGALTALETLVSFVVRPIAGSLADRYDRGRVAAAGVVLYGLSFVVYAVTPGIGLAYLAAVLGGAGGALFWVALRARVGEGLAADDGAFSKLFAAEGGGTWIAFVVALSAIAWIDYRGVFWLGAAACVVAAVVLLNAKSAPVREESAPRFLQLGRRMRPMLALVALTAMAEAGVALLLLMHLQRGHQLQLGEITAVFIPGFIVYSFLPDYLHGFVRKVGRTRVLSLAMAASALFAAGLSFAPSPVALAVMWILSAAAFAAAIPVEQAVVAEAAGLSLGRAMGIYESAALLGATIGTFLAGQLYGSDAGWRIACFGAAALLLFGSLVVRRAVRRVGVAEFPVEPAKTPSQKEKPAVGMAGESPQAAESVKADANKRANPLRNWAAHAVLYVLAQTALAMAGYSWPVEAVFGGAHTAEWYWNSSGHWLLNLGRIWTFVFVIDTVWSLGRVALKKRAY